MKVTFRFAKATLLSRTKRRIGRALTSTTDLQPVVSRLTYGTPNVRWKVATGWEPIVPWQLHFAELAANQRNEFFVGFAFGQLLRQLLHRFHWMHRRQRSTQHRDRFELFSTEQQFFATST